MVKFRVLIKCPQCQGQAYVPIGGAENVKGEKYIRYVPCQRCDGRSEAGAWMDWMNWPSAEAVCLLSRACPLAWRSWGCQQHPSGFQPDP